MSVEAAGWRRRERELPPGDARRRATHTTTPRPAVGARSRGRPCLPKRCQVTPCVSLVKWVLVVGRVRGVELGCPMLCDKGGQCLINQSSVAYATACLPGPSEDMLVDRSADPDPCHAISMPQSCYSCHLDIEMLYPLGQPDSGWLTSSSRRIDRGHLVEAAP